MSDIIHQYEPLWGSWHVDTLLGSGSFDKVYRVRKTEFGQMYYSAVKIISVPQNEEELRQLMNEGFARRGIDHPGENNAWQALPVGP